MPLDDMDKFREGIEEQIVVLQDLVGDEIADIPVDLPDELTPANPLAEIGGGAANPAEPAANAGVSGAVNVGGANGEASTGTVSVGEKLIDSDSLASPPFKNSRSTREFFYDMIVEFQQKVALQKLTILRTSSVSTHQVGN